MKFSEEKKGSLSIFYLAGRLDSNSSWNIEQKILDAMEDSVQNIIIDCAQLEYISSAGIRVFVHVYRQLEKRGGTLYLASVTKPIENILHITGFLSYFQLVDNADQAISTISNKR